MALTRRTRRLNPAAPVPPAARLRDSPAGRALARRLREAGLPDDPVAFAAGLAGWTSAAAAAAGLWMGWPGAVAGGVAAGATVVGGVRRRTQRRAHRIDEAIPAMLDGLAAALRAGASLPVAVADLEAPAALTEPVEAMRAALTVGASTRESLDVFAVRAGTAQARLVATALIIGLDSGGDVPRVLDVLAESARDRVRCAREARVASTQARLSAWVVAALPVVFLFVTGAASRPQMELLFHTPLGWALLGAGGTLEAAGLVWMRRLAA